jgi:hypothetical protein
MADTLSNICFITRESAEAAVGRLRSIAAISGAMNGGRAVHLNRLGDRQVVSACRLG